MHLTGKTQAQIRNLRDGHAVVDGGAFDSKALSRISLPAPERREAGTVVIVQGVAKQA